MVPPPPLKLLFVGPYPPRRGGSAPSLLQLTVALQERGHDVRVLAPITPETVASDASFVGTLSGLRLSRYPVPYFLYEYCHVPYDRVYRRAEHAGIEEALPRLIEAERPDVVIASQEPMAAIVPDVAKRHGLPSVLLLRGDPTWRIVDGSFPDEPGREWLESFARADRIVTVAHYFAKGLRRRGFDNVEAIPNHVDPRRFFPMPPSRKLAEEFDLCADDIIVLHASKIEPRKRPLDIVDAAALALKQRPELIFLIVGEGPSLAGMKKAAQEKGVAHRFRFAGWQPYAKMPQFFNLADIVLQPSAGEGLARIYLEAMACGRTLLASDIPAAQEVIEPGTHGFLFRTGDIADLTAQLLKAAADPALRDRIGKAGIERARVHNLDDATRAYERVFRELSRS